MKKYLSLILIPSIYILTLPFIFTIFNIFNIEIPFIIYNLLTITIMIITGYIFGFKIKDKGYLKVFLLGICISIIMFILSLISKATLTFNTFIYYLIIITSITLGTIIGTNKKDK